eukprot:scaffold11625_cov123-Isochrysis_galbana.AAC.10
MSSGDDSGGARASRRAAGSICIDAAMMVRRSRPSSYSRACRALAASAIPSGYGSGGRVPRAAVTCSSRNSVSQP